jgi:hypothetical protein
MAATDPGSSDLQEPDVTAWTGWIAFAAVMLVTVGVFEFFIAFAALFHDGYFAVPRKSLIVTIDYTAWGWIHIVLALAAIAAGIGLISGQMWARILGVVIAVINAVANVGFLNAAPVWSSIMIAFDVIVIWALTVHGGEMKRL